MLRRGRLSLEVCVTLGLKLNLALGYLHRNGLIHRDVKPPNIIFVNGVPKLADIGLVTEMTGAHSFVGTEGYVAPEGPNSPQADLYALGKLLYEASMGKDRHEFPAAFTGLGLDPDSKGLAELNAVVLRACEEDRKKRYRSAEEMNADLALLHSGKSVRHKHAVERRLKITTRVAVAAVASMVLGVLPYYLAIREARQEAEQRRRAQISEATAEQRLYDSLLREAQATRMVRRVGYRDKVFSLLKQANALAVPQKDLADLRREAGACLGDFVGLTPSTITDFPADTTIRRTLLEPSGRSAAFLLGNGTVVLRQLPSGTEIDRFQLNGELPTKSLCFNSAGNQLVFVRMPASRRLEDRIPDSRLNVWTRGADNQWRETENVPLPGAVDCLSTARGVYVTVFGDAPRSGKLMDVSTKAVVKEFEVPELRIPEVALSPDGQLLVTESTESPERADGALIVWDLKSNQRTDRLTPQLGVLGSLGFSPDGEYLMCSSKSGGKIYEVDGFHRVADFSPNARLPLVFAPDSGLVALPSSHENRIRLWDWISNAEYAALDEPKPASYTAFAPDGSFFLTVSLQHARLYRLGMTPEKLNLLRQPGNRPGVAFSPDGPHGLRITTVGLSPSIRVCDATTGRAIWQSDTLPTQGHAPVFSQDGRWLATGDYVARRVFVWDTQTGERLLDFTNTAGGRLWSVQFSPDSRILATASGINRVGENGIELWRIHRQQSGQSAKRLEATSLKSAGSSAWSLAFAPNGRSLAFVDRDLAGVYLWEFEGPSPPRCVATNLIHGIGNDQSLCFTPDSRRLIMVDRARVVVTLDVVTGERSSFTTVNPERTPDWTDSAGICLSPDGTKLAMVSASGRGVDVWDPSTGQLLYSLPEQDDTVYWQAWSPDSQRLAISHASGEVAVWDIEEIEQIMTELGLNPATSAQWKTRTSGGL